MQIDSIFIVTSGTAHFMLFNSCTQMKKRLLEKEMMVILDIASSTFSHKSQRDR